MSEDKIMTEKAEKWAGIGFLIGMFGTVGLLFSLLYAKLLFIFVPCMVVGFMILVPIVLLNINKKPSWHQKYIVPER